MKRSTWILVAALLVPGPLMAGDPADPVRFSSASPSALKPAGFVAPNETHFAGTAEVTGVIEMTSTPARGKRAGGVRVVLIPDAQSRKRLPHAVGEHEVEEVWIRNGDRAVAELLAPAERKALAAQAQTIARRATITIGAYRSAVDCDTRSYEAEFVFAKGHSVATSPVNRENGPPRC